jgi:hypothetical protein
MVALKKVLPKEGEVARSSQEEYTEVMRKRYREETKTEKGKILDEFSKVIGLHRKAAILLMNRRDQREEKKREDGRRDTV